LLRAAQWLAHARGSAEPIVRALAERPPIPQQAQFANYCRHHDELNIGLLSEQERDEVFAAFAPEEEHRVYGRGIRRRLAPMLGNDPRRIRLALALTMALPGTPVLFYGDEIGMGEDLSLPGRLAVRGPMQWSSDQGGGFSPAAKPYRPARADGPYGYRKVNVAAQRHHPGSLHSWVAYASRILRECPELGWGDWHTLDVGDPRVLVLDEPTAHLDARTADALADELLDVTRGRTALIVTHRPEQTPGLPRLHLGRLERRTVSVNAPEGVQASS